MGSEQNDSTSFPFSEPKLCNNNCGFWGNPTTMNLCSKCYKDICLKEERTAVAKAAVESSFNVELSTVTVPAASAALKTALPAEEVSSDGQSAVEEPEPRPKVGNWCGTCNKKVGLIGFKCRCGSKFCGDHRYPESHDCSFDYKSTGRDAIAKANPVVKADKVARF